MIVGERNRADDLNVNITKEKKLTNMRSSTADVLVSLRPHHQMTLDLAIEFIAEDEFVEVTPQSIRLRKSVLDASKREQLRKRRERENAPVA
jgi:GTP-binding protein